MGTRPLLLVSVFTLLTTSAAFADGRAYAGGAAPEGAPYPLRPLNEQSQHAILLHREGIQHMLVAISIDLNANDEYAFWIFPVPSQPEQTRIDLADSFPVLRGRDVSHNARGGPIYHCGVQCGLVINPVFGACVALLPALSSSGPSSVVPHDGAVEEFGLRAEAFAAGSTDALASMLAERGLEMPETELTLFEPYCNSEFSLVLTRIVSREALRERFPGWLSSRRPALYVRFPTDTLFYPMRPTAGYGDRSVPVDIVVLGEVRPRGDWQMLSLSRCHLWHLEDVPWDKFPEPMRTGFEPNSPLVYTRLLWRWANAESFVSDVTFEPIRRSAVRYELLLGRLHRYGPWAWITFFASFIVLLFVTGGLCGLIYLREWWRPACYGLLGVLSFPAVSHHMCRNLQRRGIRKRRGFATAYGLTYLVLFIILDLAMTLLLLAPLRF